MKRDEDFMITSSPLVTVVDDDESVRESLPDLIRVLGFRAEAFASAKAFLASGSVSRTDCLVLDVAMPDMSGTDLALELERRGWPIPRVFITAGTDDSLRLCLIKQGAVDCLFKPFSDEALQEALLLALKSA